MEILAVLGVAFGATYAVAMPLRTVRIRSLFWTTFAITFFATLGCVYYFPLPTNYLLLIGAIGLVVGSVLSVVQKKTTELEREYERARRARGEKVLQ